MADVPKVPVAAVTRIRGERKIDAVRFAVLDFGFTGIHRPLVAPPCGNDLQVRSKRFDTKFKSDLIITFAGRPVADRCSAFFPGNLHKTFCDDRTGHRCPKQIFVLIYSMSLYAGNNVFVTKFVNDVLYVKFGSATRLCPLFQAVQFFLLSAVDADTDYFVVKVFLQPRDDGSRIQAAGVSKYYFFFHVKTSIL